MIKEEIYKDYSKKDIFYQERYHSLLDIYEPPSQKLGTSPSPFPWILVWSPLSLKNAGQDYREISSPLYLILNIGLYKSFVRRKLGSRIGSCSLDPVD